MSTPFYDLASLVVVPSGYKSGKIYAQKPLTTDGQLTFTRASNATRVASNGLIEKVRTNLALRSQSFATAAVWSTVSGTITNNAGTAPDGTSTASKIVAGNTDPYVYQSLTLTGSVAVSCYVKGVGSSIGKIARILVGSSMTDVTMDGTWQRISVAHTAAGAELYGLEIPNPAVTSDEVLMWGFQVETGDIATAYIATTSAAVSVGPVSGLPRLDYLNSTCPRLLLEPQRTNSALFSEQFDNGNWVKTSATVTANTTVSPDGYNNADTVAFGASTEARCEVNLAGTLENQSHTISVYAKVASGTSTFRLKGTHAGVVNYISNDFTATTDWQRFTYTVTFGASVGTGIIYAIQNGSNGTAKNVIFYGFQLELNSAYATSYIPTLGTSVTKVADAASKTGISSLIGQTEGTLFVDMDFTNRNEVQVFIEVGNGTTERILIYCSGNSIIAFANASVFSYTQSTNERIKIAFAYKSGNSALYVNGVQKQVSSAALTYGALPNFLLGSNVAGVQTNTNPISQALLFKTRLTNAQLAELTTL
jgi:hypothetical protein